jgi:hypothetical protein
VRVGLSHKLGLVGFGVLVLDTGVAVQYSSFGRKITSSIPVGASIGPTGGTGGEGSLK